MRKVQLFTDGSVNARAGVGFGAYLKVEENSDYKKYTSSDVQLKKFQLKSSTEIELVTLLWALTEQGDSKESITIYTDSENIINLPRRRANLEEKNFYSKKGTLLKNHDLYRKFFGELDRLEFKLFKIKGHKQSSKKNGLDQLFALVDKASRAALRKELN